MTSPKKVRANRENGKLGGVKTAEGKTKSKNNSLKHGILSHGSNPDDPISLERMYEHFRQEFNPETPSREILVQQLAITVTRLSRCLKLESEITKDQTMWKWETTAYLDRLATLGERYESRLVGRMLRLMEALKEG